jgi:hypothetical protein
MNMRYRPLLRTILWLLVGLLVGAGLGLFLGWVAWPTEFTDADPTVLAESYQRDYTIMVAAAFDIEGDLPAAERRLADLGKEDARAWLLSVAVDHILAGQEDSEIRHLVKLATALDLYSPAMEPFLPAEGPSNQP